MALAVSKRAQRVKPSATLAVTALAARLKAEGKDVIGLGAGEPDFDTPAHISAAGVQAINSGFTRYTNVDGVPELKDAIVAKFQRDNGIKYERSQILVSSGAKQTIFNLCMALLDPGDEVVIPAPYWVSYPDMALLADGVPVTPYAGPEQNYKITPQQLAQAITPRTRLLLINSPSNPTGAAYTAAEWRALGRSAAQAPARGHRHRRHVREDLLGQRAVQQFVDRGARTLRSNGHDQWLFESLRDDRMAHRLLRRA